MMSGRAMLPAAIVAAGLLPGATIAVARDRAIDVSGWTLADVGHKPGDDSNRVVSIEKAIPEIDLIYRPSESNSGGSIQAEFKRQRTCAAMRLSSAFDFDPAPADRVARVRKEVHEAFADFTKTCPAIRPDAEERLMAGFGAALAAVDTLMTDKPNVYPKEPAEDGNSQDQSNI